MADIQRSDAGDIGKAVAAIIAKNFAQIPQSRKSRWYLDRTLYYGEFSKQVNYPHEATVTWKRGDNPSITVTLLDALVKNVDIYHQIQAELGSHDIACTPDKYGNLELVFQKSE